MSAIKLTQEEAERLLNMMKRSLIAELDFPTREDKNTEFDVEGETKRDLFTIKIFRGKINRLKYDFGARIKKNGILLLELHINPSNVHYNPDGTKLCGSHWHIYTEEFGRRLAFPAEDIESEQFVENTIMFLEKFHVIKQPEVKMQLELV